MSQSRSRWFVKVVLLLAVISFVGFSIAPLLNAAFRQSQTSSPVSSVTGSQTSSKVEPKEKLEAQARGYQAVLQREPDNQIALQGLVQAQIQLQKPKEAIAPMEKLVELNPNQREYKLLLAQLKQYDGDRSGAIQVYRSILATKPGDMDALHGAVGLLFQQNQSEAALGLLQDTLKAAERENQTQPGSVDVPAVQLLLAQVYTAEKRNDEAIAVYDRVINENKQDFRPVLAKAVLLSQQGKTEQAKSLFESAQALAPAQLKEVVKRQADFAIPKAEPTPAAALPKADPPSSK